MNGYWLNYLTAAISAVGAFSSWQQWLWQPYGFDIQRKAVGLFFFEGWLVFLLLGFAAGVQLVRAYAGCSVNRIAAVLAALAMTVCMEFAYAFGSEQVCNALWLSLLCSVIALVFLVLLWLRQSPPKIVSFK